MAVEIRRGIVDDAQDMLELDYRTFPGDWHVNPNFVPRILEKNQYIFRVLKVDGEHRGHTCFIPLPKEQYELILNGEISEYDLIDYVVDYDHPKDVWLYIATINVEQGYDDSQKWAVKMIRDVQTTVDQFRQLGANIVEIGCIGISDQGRSLVERIGFEHCGHIVHEDGTKDKVYRCDPNGTKFFNR